ncbi:MAG: AAA family ATPase, partial [Crocosphaera sp.]
MKFEISNLGYIKQAEIELADLTIICGKNNTGKT